MPRLADVAVGRAVPIQIGDCGGNVAGPATRLPRHFCRFPDEGALWLGPGQASKPFARTDPVMSGCFRPFSDRPSRLYL